jgi:isopropylmalate/homocitrate/citramalate synthase
MGLALENTIQAVVAGAAGISGTFGGIGERSGNVALEQVLNGLRLRFGWEVDGIDYDALTTISEYLAHHNIRAHPPYSQQAQRHEAGIHVHSLLRDRHSYAIFPHGQPEIWFGKCSGISNVQYLFEHHLRQPLTRDQYERLSLAIKALSIQENRSFSVAEVVQMIRTGRLTV